MHPVFVALAQRVFEQTVVLCYRERCERHYPGGGAWPDHVQSKILVQDGADTDERFVLGKFDTFHAKLHSLRGFVAHVFALHSASERNLSNVLLLEDDAIASEFANESLGTPEALMNFTDALRAKLARRPWQALKFTAAYGDKEIGAKKSRPCPEKCTCRLSEDWRMMTPVSRLEMCRTQGVGTLPPTFRCDFRNSAVYAVHSSAFHIYSREWRNLKKASASYPYIDFFNAAYIDFDHFLPSLAVQDHRLEDYQTSVRFRDLCAA